MEPLLTIENLSVQFGGVKAVNGVSFKVRDGEIYTLIGPNGAGKTTLFNIINRLNEPSAGRVLFQGKDLGQCLPHQVARLGIARTFQNIELFEHASVLHNLMVGCHVRRTTNLWEELLFLPSVRRAEYAFRDQVERVIDFLDLQHHRDAMVSSLPYGARKVVELARALCMRPKLLLLDEPSSGLNPEESDDMAFWIQDIRSELGITLLLVEHDMNLVSRVSDRVLALNQGEVLVEGTPSQVQSDPGVIEAYLGSVTP